MQERIDSIRQDVDSIRKSGKLPHWRMVYADALLARAQDYMAVDRSPEAVRVLDKLDRWAVDCGIHICICSHKRIKEFFFRHDYIDCRKRHTANIYTFFCKIKIIMNCMRNTFNLVSTIKHEHSFK